MASSSSSTPLRRKPSFFPTAPASRCDTYAFAKLPEAFLPDERSADPDNFFCKVNIVNKAPKAEKKNSIREEKDWYKFQNSTVAEDKVSRIYPICTAMGEILRLSIGNSHPKYRYTLPDTTEKMYLLSERIQGLVKFSHYFEKNLRSKERSGHFESKDCFEDMGRSIFYKFFYKDNDVHFNNMGFDKDGQFIVYDHDQMLGHVTMSMRISTLPKTSKIIKFDLKDHKSIESKEKREVIDLRVDPEFDPYWVVSRPITDMGTEHRDDYKNLPVINHFLPTNWQFKENPHYSIWLSKQPLFLNEKHFSMIQLFTTKDIIENVLDTHISHPEDNASAKNFFDARMDTFLQDEAFITYLSENYLSVTQTIFFELNENLRSNKHYQSKDTSDQERQWELCYTSILSRLNVLLSKFEKALTEKEVADLTLFAKAIKANDPAALNSIVEFYHRQLMTRRATEVIQKITELEKTPKSSEDRKSESPPVETSEKSSSETLKRACPNMHTYFVTLHRRKVETPATVFTSSTLNF